MFGGPNPSYVNLAHIYAANNESIATAMARIASGKRVMVPSDDFYGYIKASGLESTNSQYETIKQNLSAAKGFFDYAVEVGDSITDLVDRLYELKGLYDGAVGDAVAQAGYKAEYDATIEEIADIKDDAYYDGYKVYQIAALYKDVTVNDHGDVNRLTTTDIADETAINDIATTTQNLISAELASSYTYTQQVKSAANQMTVFSNLADTIISSNNASISVITDINEVAEISALTALQVRQQATVAMMAQASTILGYSAKLYGGSS